RRSSDLSDPLKDFATICLLAVNPYVLVVNSSVPAKNVPELIALLRANPGKYSFSSSGSGASSHLASVLFNSMANVSAVHVPYKGSSPSVTDLVSGQVAYTIETVPRLIRFRISARLDREAGGPEAGLNTSISKDMTEKLRPIRRVVTGNDGQGRSRVLFDSAAPNVNPGAVSASAAMTDIWVFHSCPAVISGERD